MCQLVLDEFGIGIESVLFSIKIFFPILVLNQFFIRNFFCCFDQRKIVQVFPYIISGAFSHISMPVISDHQVIEITCSDGWLFFLPGKTIYFFMTESEASVL